MITFFHNVVTTFFCWVGKTLSQRCEKTLQKYFPATFGQLLIFFLSLPELIKQATKQSVCAPLYFKPFIYNALDDNTLTNVRLIQEQNDGISDFSRF